MIYDFFFMYMSVYVSLQTHRLIFQFDNQENSYDIKIIIGG